MPQLVWFNQPTNHSGTVNFLYLDPDGQIGKFSMYVADGGGPYIMGGPALGDDRGDFTMAARTLIGLLPSEIHFFPPSSTQRIRQAIADHQGKIDAQSSRLSEDEWWLQICSPAYTTKQCCGMLLANAQPEASIVFVDEEHNGTALLAVDLAQIYYRLPKEQRQQLKLGPDWDHHFEG